MREFPKDYRRHPAVVKVQDSCKPQAGNVVLNLDKQYLIVGVIPNRTVLDDDDPMLLLTNGIGEHGYITQSLCTWLPVEHDWIKMILEHPKAEEYGVENWVGICHALTGSLVFIEYGTLLEALADLWLRLEGEK